MRSRFINATLLEFLSEVTRENIAVISVNEEDEGACLFKGKALAIYDEIEKSIYKDAVVAGIATGKTCVYTRDDKSFDNCLVIFVALEPAENTKFRKRFYDKLKDPADELNLDFPEVTE